MVKKSPFPMGLFSGGGSLFFFSYSAVILFFPPSPPVSFNNSASVAGPRGVGISRNRDKNTYRPCFRYLRTFGGIIQRHYHMEGANQWGSDNDVDCKPARAFRGGKDPVLGNQEDITY